MEPGGAATYLRHECIICMLEDNDLQGPLRPLRTWHAALGTQCHCEGLVHWRCLQPWLQTRKECPVCRKPVELSLPPPAPLRPIRHSRVHPVSAPMEIRDPIPAYSQSRIVLPPIPVIGIQDGPNARGASVQADHLPYSAPDRAMAHPPAVGDPRPWCISHYVVIAIIAVFVVVFLLAWEFP